MNGSWASNADLGSILGAAALKSGNVSKPVPKIDNTELFYPRCKQQNVTDNISQDKRNGIRAQNASYHLSNIETEIALAVIMTNIAFDLKRLCPSGFMRRHTMRDTRFAMRAFMIIADFSTHFPRDCSIFFALSGKWYNENIIKCELMERMRKQNLNQP